MTHVRRRTWWLLFPVISGKVIWTRHYGVCKPFCLLYLNAIIQSTKVITSRYSISYSGLLGYYVDVEVRTSRGRVDVVLRTEATLYVMELKLDKNATVAMEQINLKNYPERFALCGLPVVKVAVNFDSESGTLGDWMIEK